MPDVRARKPFLSLWRPLAASFFLTVCLAASAQTAPTTVQIPLPPNALTGGEAFTLAEHALADVARTLHATFLTDSHPLPPSVILHLDTPEKTVLHRNGILFWRGEMLPDQLAPAEAGVLLRKAHLPDVPSPVTIRTRSPITFSDIQRARLTPFSHTVGTVTLPPTFIETPYHLGTLDSIPVRLVLWRAIEEDTHPIGGYLQFSAPPSPAFLNALRAALPPLPAGADWQTQVDTFAAP